MSAQGIGWRAAALLAAAASAAGCGSPFGRFRGAEGVGVADAPYPRLLEARQTAEALGASPDPAVGSQVVADLDAEAAASAAQSARTAVPVFDVPSLKADAQTVREATR